MPDADDDSTYEVNQDRCGIWIFKVAIHSKCVCVCAHVRAFVRVCMRQRLRCIELIIFYYIVQDMNFLQRAPECVAPTDKSMYLDRILKETCPKLLKSGLLTSTEQQWWESYSSVVMTYLQASGNVSKIKFSFFTFITDNYVKV